LLTIAHAAVEYCRKMALKIKAEGEGEDDEDEDYEELDGHSYDAGEDELVISDSAEAMASLMAMNLISMKSKQEEASPPADDAEAPPLGVPEDADSDELTLDEKRSMNIARNKAMFEELFKNNPVRAPVLSSLCVEGCFYNSVFQVVTAEREAAQAAAAKKQDALEKRRAAAALRRDGRDGASAVPSRRSSRTAVEVDPVASPAGALLTTPKTKGKPKPIPAKKAQAQEPTRVRSSRAFRYATHAHVPFSRPCRRSHNPWRYPCCEARPHPRSYNPRR
jgi:hypothetical protein